MTEIHIKELDLEMLSPNASDYMATGKDRKGGTKLIVIGKPKTGKSTLIKSILYSKKQYIPVGLAICGSEDSNGDYANHFPSTFVYSEYSEEVLENFRTRQKMAKRHLSNPWGVCLLDDCTSDTSVFKRPLQHDYYKLGRHWDMLYIVSLQYAMDILPVIRTTVDGVFILREPNLKNRKVLYENYASIIPSFDLFCSIMDVITDDKTALYIHNITDNNDWLECVFWYKAKIPPDDWTFGCPEFWLYHYDRYDPEYVEELI